MLKARYSINAHKATTPIVMLCLMRYYDNFSQSAWFYYSLHSSYAACWIVKENVFPDKSFDNLLPHWMSIGIFLSLIGYWFPGYYLISSHGNPHQGTMVAAIFMFSLGMMFHLGSDCQKKFTLAHGKRLITDGFFRYSRNPNYFGEILTYMSWIILTENIYIVLFMCVVMAFMMAYGMIQKAKSLSRYKEYKEYSEKTPFLIPKLW